MARGNLLSSLVTQLPLANGAAGLAAASTQVWALEFMGAGRLEKVDERGPSAPSTAR